MILFRGSVEYHYDKLNFFYYQIRWIHFPDRNYPFVYLWLVVFFYSCGGVIGNIEKYPFPDTTQGKLKAALNNVYLKYPQIQKTDTTMYGRQNGDEFYFMLQYEGTRFVFLCHIIPAYSINDDVELSLTSATAWGEVMNVAPKLGFFEKKKYRKLFEEFILPKVKEEIAT